MRQFVSLKSCIRSSALVLLLCLSDLKSVDGLKLTRGWFLAPSPVPREGDLHNFVAQLAKRVETLEEEILDLKGKSVPSQEAHKDTNVDVELKRKLTEEKKVFEKQVKHYISGALRYEAESFSVSEKLRLERINENMLQLYSMGMTASKVDVIINSVDTPDLRSVIEDIFRELARIHKETLVNPFLYELIDKLYKVLETRFDKEAMAKINHNPDVYFTRKFT